MLSNSVASYFVSEMEGWKETIGFYEQEMERSLLLLKSIIQMNTIPGLATKVDHYYRGYEGHQIVMKEFSNKLEAFSNELLNEDEPVVNNLIGEQETGRQKDLRVEMQQLEKGYLSYKYEVDEFIAETLIVQGRHAS